MRERAEGFARTLVEWARPLIHEMNADPTGVFLFDQAAAEMRRNMAERGVNVDDPTFIVAWFTALDTLLECLPSCDNQFDEAITMTLLTGLMGRVAADGDSGSGT